VSAVSPYTTALPARVLRAWVELTKPRIVTLVLFTALPALVLAGPAPARVFWGALAGIGLSAAAAAAFNHYYDRDIDGLPRHWIKRMMNSIASLAWRFSAHRMVMDYVQSAYLTAAGGLSCDMSVR